MRTGAASLRRREVVGVFYGGDSTEHAVSRASAASVVRHLDPAQYDVVAIGIDRAGTWHRMSAGGVEQARLSVADGPAIEDQLPVRGPIVGTDVLRDLTVAFPVLHGAAGENGSLQGLFEVFGLPYVGSGVLASATGLDKIASKRAFERAGLDQARYVALDEHEWVPGVSPMSAMAHLRRPWFVKPAGSGSSIGISRVTDPSDLNEALRLAFDHDARVLIEEGIDGARELECGVLGGDQPEASAVGEVRVTGGWFDFQQKYYGPADPMTVPARLPADVSARVREASVRAFAAIGGWGLARVDFLYQPESDRLVVNELNTIPGFTAHSMYPKVWAAAGVPFGQLLDRLVRLALERHARRTARAGRRTAAVLDLARAR